MGTEKSKAKGGKLVVSEQVAIGDLPQELTMRIKDEVARYSTILIGVNQERNAQTANMIGSGTFVQYGKIYGILTANHVTSSSAFRHADRIGLHLMTETTHHFSIPTANLRTITVGEPASGKYGPDISVIILPLSEVPAIKAKKVFWNLDKYQVEILQGQRDISDGPWVLCGCPDTYTQRAQKLDGFDHVIQHRAFAWLSGIAKEWTEHRFDYLDYHVAYDESGDVPKSFGGVSGGGLWQVRLVQNNAGDIAHENLILSGVAFCESDIVDNQRMITCHGRSSVYRNVVEALRGLQV